MAHITLSQLRTVLERIVSWATSKFAARNVTSGKLEYADMPVVVLASMGAELDGAQISLSPGSTFFQPAGPGVGAQISFLTSDNHVVKISDPVSSVIYCNAYTDLLYRWDTAQAKMIPVGGTSSGSIDVSGKADLLTPANMLSPSQWPKVVLRNVTDEEVASLVEGDVFFDSGSLWYRGASGSTEIGTPSKQAIYYCLADGKMYHWNGNSFEAVSLSVEDGRLLRLKTTVIVDEIKANASYDSLPSGKTEYIYYRAGDGKLVRMFLSGGSTVTEVYDPDPRVAYFNKDKGKFMYYFNGQFHNALAIDDEPTEDSSNPVSSGGVYTALAGKQNTIIAGNGITIAQDGKTVSVAESIRTGAAAGATAVQPGALDSAMATKQNVLTFDDAPTAGSDNPVKSKGVKQAIDEKLSNVTVNTIPAGSVGIIDDCVTDSDTDALSARQGKELNDRLEELEEGGAGGMTAVFEGTKLVFKAAADLPMIRVSRGRINFPETEENNTRTATFVVKGKNLTGGITLALTDTSGMFSISQNAISAANANGETTITVTYAPTAIGSHSASIALSSGEATNTVELSGTAVEEIIPEININDNSSVTIAAETGNTVTKSIQFDALHLQPNEQVALTIEGINDITVAPAMLTADENGSIDATLTLTYTAGSADVNGTLVASCTTIARSTIGVTGHVAVRLSAGSYWDDGMFRYTVLTNTNQVSVAKNPNATISGTLTFPARVSDDGKDVYDSGGNEVTASGIDYVVAEIPEGGFKQCYGISGLVFESDGVKSIGTNAFNMHPNGARAGEIQFKGTHGVYFGRTCFFKCAVGNFVMNGNITGLSAFGDSSNTFDRLDFGAAVTSVTMDVWTAMPPKTTSIIICRSTTPPSVNGSMLDRWKSLTLYVPDVQAYQSHSKWGQITTIKDISELS